ncbi:DUF1249 domain-containing protein [Shewanella putrefaciens]|uniref:DUF1249 domain-containing protein n=1 Tax=Shewanella putrefaciens TaxID=24 RepID=A0ABX8XE11_SHEPU|nr:MULTISPECIES: DUF1249 domain-containing protein [Shewanella]AVV83795.1 hypothetical protein SPWS13_2002 [Shewanella putrefaciens]MCA1897932.1 DUF1249 domain-containing protein [Shewanella putrefaciens]MCK7628969.1 DUF1249 domain-containing protein [Shewanella sp. JNE9-1]MCK7633459.1 DUF1249 domain-containing protein [Shewanella sp. JNE17]MCK7644218.1 DUF1249 domain-containing protein [Shewanella sp. JNE3-1]
MATSTSHQKPRYRPNVSDFLALCGRNYGYMLKWLPLDIAIGQSWQLKGEFGILVVRILENTKYTQLVEISRPLATGEFVNTPKVLVRIYHDAKLAEVLTGQQIYQLRPVYDYPNLRMYHSDEKYQVNAFLEELLKIGNQQRLVCQS